MKISMKLAVKAILLLIFTIALISNMYATTKLSESFTGTTFPPPGWSSKHISGILSAGTWFRDTTSFLSAPACARSDAGLLAENFLITKRFTPAAGDSLVFYVNSNYVLSTGRLDVKVSTTDSLTGSFIDFVIPLNINLQLLTQNVWVRMAVSLNAYAGQPIFIAFRHLEIAGLGGSVKLDGISVGTGGVDLNLTVLMEGHMGAETIYNIPRRDRDTVTVSIRSVTSPFAILESKKVFLDTLGKKTINYALPVEGVKYYIVVQHRNSIRTWSDSGGVAFNGGSLTYDFTTGLNKAFHNNMKLILGKATLFTGDPNQDGIVDLTDLILIYNDAITFTSGSYLATDLNWDEFVDLSDLELAYNNSINIVKEEAP